MMPSDKTTTASHAKPPKVFLAGFGKYPLLSEYVQDLGNFSDALLELRGKLGDKLKRIQPQDIGSLNHWVAWVVPGGTVLARIIPSEDLMRRPDSFTVMAELQNCPLEIALRKIAPELDSFIQRVMKLPTPDVVRAQFGTQRGTLESMIVSETSMGENLVPSPQERGLFFEKAGLDPEGLALARLLYKTESSWKPYLPLRGGKLPKLQDPGVALRLPALEQDWVLSVQLWDELVSARIHPEIPRLYVKSPQQDWLDLTVGPLSDRDFENLVKSRTVLAPETTILHPVTPELQSKAVETMRDWREKKLPSAWEIAKLLGSETAFFARAQKADPAAVQAPNAKPSDPVAPLPERAPSNKRLLFVIGAAVICILLLAFFLIGGSKYSESHPTNEQQKVAPKPMSAIAPVVHPTARLEGDKSVHEGDSVALKVSLTGQAPWLIKWSDGKSNTVQTPDYTRLVSPKSDATYNIIALSDDMTNARSEDITGSASIKVDSRMKVKISGSTQLETGDAGTLVAKVEGGTPPYKYYWSTTGRLKDATKPVQMVQPAEGTTNIYQVRVTDSFEEPCSAETTVRVVAKLHDPPTAFVRLSGPQAICRGDSTEVIVELTGKKPWTLEWADGTATIVSNTPYRFTVSPTINTEYVLQSVTDVLGTKAREIKGGPSVTVYNHPKASVSGGGQIAQGQAAVIQVQLEGVAPWQLAWSDGFRETADRASWTRTVPSSNANYSLVTVTDAHCAAKEEDMRGLANFSVMPPLQAPAPKLTSNSIVPSLAGELDKQVKQLLVSLNITDIKTPSIKSAPYSASQDLPTMIREGVVEEYTREYLKLDLLDDNHKNDLERLKNAIKNYNAR